MAKVNVKGLAFGLQMTAGGVVQREAGIKGDDRPARLSQLPAGIFLGVRFAGDLTEKCISLSKSLELFSKAGMRLVGGVSFPQWSTPVTGQQNARRFSI